MPSLYLSPSTQEFNQYVNGGDEELYMNLIADAMVPYLRASGIQFTRNTPSMTAASSIVQSNQGNYDLHLALHSNAAPPSLAGTLQGTDVYYYPESVKGKQAAEIIAQNLKNIYPYPDLVKAVPTTTLGEVRRTKAPAVLIEFAYHDNVEDANWIKNNIDAIAANVVQSVCTFFDIPFISTYINQPGIVRISSGYLNIREKPTTFSASIGKLYAGEEVTVLGKWENWYTINSYGIIGYVEENYIQVV